MANYAILSSWTRTDAQLLVDSHAHANQFNVPQVKPGKAFSTSLHSNAAMDSMVTPAIREIFSTV
jgi:hypothetical protein